MLYVLYFTFTVICLYDPRYLLKIGFGFKGGEGLKTDITVNSTVVVSYSTGATYNGIVFKLEHSKCLCVVCSISSQGYANVKPVLAWHTY